MSWNQTNDPFGQPAYGNQQGGLNQPATGYNQPATGYGQQGGYGQPGYAPANQGGFYGAPAQAQNACSSLTCKLIVDTLILLGLCGNFINLSAWSLWYLILLIIFLVFLVWCIWCLVIHCGTKRDNSTFNALWGYGEKRVWIMYFYVVIALLSLILAIVFWIKGAGSSDSSTTTWSYAIAWSSFVNFLILCLFAAWFWFTREPFLQQVKQEHPGH